MRIICYDFSTLFIFENFVVSELNQGISFNWDDYVKAIVEEISTILDINGSDVI